MLLLHTSINIEVMVRTNQDGRTQALTNPRTHIHRNVGVATHRQKKKMAASAKGL